MLSAVSHLVIRNFTGPEGQEFFTINDTRGHCVACSKDLSDAMITLSESGFIADPNAPQGIYKLDRSWRNLIASFKSSNQFTWNNRFGNRMYGVGMIHRRRFLQIIRAAYLRGEFVMLEDGYFRWAPQLGIGCLTSDDLEHLAHHLRERNAPTDVRDRMDAEAREKESDSVVDAGIWPDC